MKIYTKNINGIPVFKASNAISIVKDGFQIINPTHEMLVADGWEVFGTSVSSEEDVLKQAKNKLHTEIEDYDKSNAVNVFRIYDTEIWLDKTTRTGLMLRFQAEQNMGLTETSLWYNGISYTLNLESAVQMLYMLEVYASACYDNTQRHLSNVDNLETLDDVTNYDYRTGYPEVLNF